MKMNKKGIHAELLVGLGLVVLFAILIAVFTGQQKEKTEKTIFGQLWEKFFPNKIETVIIPGTTVGEGCSTIELPKDDPRPRFAQAIIDCWIQGHGSSGVKGAGEVKCCYKIDTTKIDNPISELSTKQALRSKPAPGPGLADWTFESINWNIKGSIQPGTGIVLCYNDGYVYDNVYIATKSVC